MRLSSWWLCKEFGLLTTTGRWTHRVAKPPPRERGDDGHEHALLDGHADELGEESHDALRG
eukprot:31260-Pelagococcus_subviridis.AAC.22